MYDFARDRLNVVLALQVVTSFQTLGASIVILRTVADPGKGGDEVGVGHGREGGGIRRQPQRFHFPDGIHPNFRRAGFNAMAPILLRRGWRDFGGVLFYQN
jgi:hypothetical protein